MSEQTGIIDRLADRRVTAGASAAGLLLVLTGCYGEAHGVAGLELLDCKDGPKINSMTIENFAKGKAFELGKNLRTYDAGDGSGESIEGPLEITSLGAGEVKVEFRSFNDDSESGSLSGASSIVTPDESLSLTDHDQIYKFTTAITAGENTTLTIDAACV